ncbi:MULTISPECIES: phosphate ABC transporter permease PstA [Carboxydocella]|uniref:Phosphate transport system permease protein PstA n=2 Tax=Carboxydocella TaxID=178898 RepID=A0A1T4Q4S3_9FIRM|nr:MULTISPECIES: phosphate ABC transporter permease PstA [Carboxydocella]AVX21162.1 phosphate ABC transporter membrane protein 2, PhoT family [Carboxydocella thermautotrophica]AVX31597.1 phosphate ABC transporter membrane protein 2, PhoT family [Carboxydocella thermautotrophica]GAW30285.1 phosphate abc transporter, permease protein psta [Carboxydocella sp. JDF658]SJZ98785.1 phosphate ABC transporter membrane protein 2, PhoT family [Carboxydocella sporoproducens DSM 16521]
MSPKLQEKIAFSVLRLVTILIIAVLAWLLYDILSKGLPAISWDFLTDKPRRGMTKGGIFPAIVGTLHLVFWTIVFALPTGVMTAIYLSEYARDNWLTRLIRLAIMNLAGIPSVVFGLFGLGLFVIYFGFGASILAGSLTLALMTLPVIITTAEEALRTVPQSYRQASLALGATKLQTIIRIVLPQAMPGIITGSILGIARAAGETAPILLTVAAFFLPKLPTSIFDQVMALPYHLYVIATQVPGVEDKIPYGTAVVLLMLVLGLNLTATLLRSYFARQR